MNATMTLEELKEWLASTYSECDLVDLLEVSSSEIVEAFSDKVEEKMDEIEREMEFFNDSEETEDQT